MSQEPSSAPAPESARTSSAGLVVVGGIAVAALALGAYAAFVRKPAAADASGSHITVSSVEVERRLAALEQRVAGAASTDSPQPVAATAAPSPPASRDNTGAGLFEVVPNAELKGRLGRLVVEFPPGNDVKARTEVFKPGEARGLRTDFGNVAVEMTAGTYDLNIGGAIVVSVPIKSGHDTRVRVGVLRLNASGNTRFELFPPGETKSLGTYFGQTDVGLPVGPFEVEVNGQRERVTIESGKVAEF